MRSACSSSLFTTLRTFLLKTQMASRTRISCSRTPSSGSRYTAHARRLLFASFRSIALSVSSYDEFRRSPAHQDYSRLKQRCRQKYLQLTVTKTLVIRDAIVVTDLTERVERLGSSPVAHGSFSDVWKAMWEDPVEHRPRFVCATCFHSALPELGC